MISSTISGQSLQDCVSAYSLERSLCIKAEYQLRHSAELFERWMDAPIDVGCVDEDDVSRWLQQLQDSGLSARSVWNHRANLLTVLRFAAESGECQPFALSRVRSVRRPTPSPVAWTLDEVQRILSVCRTWPGTFLVTGARRNLYLTTLVLVTWDTGLRRSDTTRLRRTQVRDDGTVVLSQHKTGLPHWPRMRHESLEGFLRLPGDPPLRLPYACDSDFYRVWKRIIAAAGVRPGCLQQLRRSGATHLASEHPEAVQRYLGHSSPEMQRWYVDWSIARPQQWMPPELSH